MKEFVKKHYLLVTNIICFIWVAMCFVSENIVFRLGISIVFMVWNIFAVNYIIAICLSTFIIAMNIAAFIAVKKDEEIAILAAMFGGILGAFISTYVTNENYQYKKAINVLFTISVWIIIWILASIMAYSYYGYP